MGAVQPWYAGNTGRLTVTFVSGAGVPAAPSAATIEVREAYDNTEVVPPTNVLGNTTGTGVHFLDFTPATAGIFRAIARGTVENKPEVAVLVFRVESPDSAVQLPEE